MTEVDNKELARRLRQNLLGVLELWTSKEQQLEYQEIVPIAYVSAELFCKWEDFYHPDTKHFKMAFVEKEREILADFNKLLIHVNDKTETDLPHITDFVKTNDWLVLNQAADDTMKRIKNTSTNKG